MKIAYDDNLGLLSSCANLLNCEIVAYHDLGKMIDEFEKQKYTIMYLPVGALPYFNDYDIIAQSLLSRDGRTAMQSNFVSTKNISVSDISQQILGRINKYCTTSFWAPLIYLMKFLPKHTVLSFKDTDGFQDLLHKTATKQIDCAMVWDVILQKNPSDANLVHALFQESDLPAPVMVARKNTVSSIQEKIIFSMKSDKNSFFNGFQLPDIKKINEFLLNIDRTRQFFQIYFF